MHGGKWVKLFITFLGFVLLLVTNAIQDIINNICKEQTQITFAHKFM